MGLHFDNTSGYNLNDSDSGEAFPPMNVYFLYKLTWLAVMLTVFALVGTFSTLPVLVVYFGKRETLATNTFIKVLAILDMMVCSMIIPYTVVFEFQVVTSDFTCRTFEFLRHFAISASNLTLVAIAVERYFAVCKITKKLSVQNVNFVGENESDYILKTKSFISNTKKYCRFTYSVIGITTATTYQVVQMVTFFLTFALIVVLYSTVYYVLWKRTKTRCAMFRRKRSCQTGSGCDVIFGEQPGGIELDNSIHGERSANSFSDNSPKFIDNNESLSDISEQTFYIREAKISCNREDVENNFKGSNNNNNNNHKINKIIVFEGSSLFRRFKIECTPKLKRNQRKNVSHRRTAKMLFLCSVIYLVSYLPFWLDVFGFTNNILLRYFFFMGNASNPIIYGIANDQLRRSFWGLLRNWYKKCCCKGNRTVVGHK
ncbi:hypothetical protein CHS0354_005119 [Potamilus streckersoni]|uniref:G-protein coupled receptors family 1 profile domain-containing protein n=1 Tax=Potamilus streckersoni TaxID=2493646 RepID=A0AAE0SH30_9BIVA|nr:hypothetical protein CHS0354_005119 [Potamilus streckersoni]